MRKLGDRRVLDQIWTPKNHFLLSCPPPSSSNWYYSILSDPKSYQSILRVWFSLISSLIAQPGAIFFKARPIRTYLILPTEPDRDWDALVSSWSSWSKRSEYELHDSILSSLFIERYVSPVWWVLVCTPVETDHQSVRAPPLAPSTRIPPQKLSIDMRWKKSSKPTLTEHRIWEDCAKRAKVAAARMLLAWRGTSGKWRNPKQELTYDERRVSP